MGIFVHMLDRVQIDNPREGFFSGSAEVRFYSFSHTEMFSLPELNDLLSTQDPDAARDKVRGVAQSLMGHWTSIEARHIGPGHVFDFESGKCLLRLDKIPDFLEWQMLVLESDKDVRDLGNMIQEILPDEKVDTIASSVLTLAGGLTPAGATTKAAITLTKFLFNGVTRVLMANENDQIGLVSQSFIRPLHYPNGSRTKALVDDLTRNMWYDYTLFGTEDSQVDARA